MQRRFRINETSFDYALLTLGDWVVGDADGVAIARGNGIEDIVAAGRQRAQAESRYFEQLRAGATTVQLLELDATPVTVTLTDVARA